MHNGLSEPSGIRASTIWLPQCQKASMSLHSDCCHLCVQAGDIITGLQSVPVYKLPLMLSAPRKFSWENAFIDFSMADHDTVAAAAAEAKEAAMAAAAAEAAASIPGIPAQPA